MLRAVGYGKKHFAAMVIAENAFLLLSGLVIGTVCALLAIASFWRWEANERAMRLGNPLPSSRLPQLLAIGVGVAALIAAVVAAFGAK